MKPIQALTSAFQNYVTFSGRASRGDYWWYILAFILGTVLIAILDMVLFGGGTAEVGTGDGFSFNFEAGALASLWMLANFIPMISIGVRRLHDTDRAGWMYLLALVPLVNFYLLYIFTTKGTAGPNRFGAARIV